MIPKLNNLANTQTASPPARGVRFGVLLASCFLLLATTIASAQYRVYPDTSTPAAVPNAAITPKPNAEIPQDLPFVNSDGKAVKLGDLFHHDKPVILSLVYFSCPNLCGLTQDSLLGFVREAPHGIQLGKDYDIVVVSIDPDDDAKTAALTRKNYLAKVPLPESQPGFTYLTGTSENIKTLADAVGFPYHANPANTDSNKFAHDSGIFICTPDARLSQTILGIVYEPEELHYRLHEASGGKVGGTLLGVALSCGAMYFNPKTGRYENNPWFYVGSATGIVTIFSMATFLIYMFTGAFWWTLLIGFVAGKRSNQPKPPAQMTPRP